MEIYFDNAATTKPLKEVIDKVALLNESLYGNPSSNHKLGFMAAKELKNSTENIADALNVSPSQIVFTSGGTEANNLAILGSLRSCGKRRHIITCKAEHPSVYEVFKCFEKSGFPTDYLPLNSAGYVDMNALESALSDDTALISLMQVNNETGTIQDIEHIAALVKAKAPGALFHVDGVQGFAKHTLNLKNIDMYSFSAHKIHGLKGVGALYVKNPAAALKQVFYGGSQQHGIRPGTENTYGISTFALAVSIAFENKNSNLKHVAALKAELISLLSTIKGLEVNGDKEYGSPYILNVSIPGVKSEVLVHALEEKDVYISTGASCSSKKKDKNILRHYGLSDTRVESALRISFSHTNNLGEIASFVPILKQKTEYLLKINRN